MRRRSLCSTRPSLRRLIHLIAASKIAASKHLTDDRAGYQAPHFQDLRQTSQVLGMKSGVRHRADQAQGRLTACLPIASGRLYSGMQAAQSVRPGTGTKSAPSGMGAGVLVAESRCQATSLPTCHPNRSLLRARNAPFQRPPIRSSNMPVLYFFPSGCCAPTGPTGSIP